ncbi:MAG: hypothetical protein ACRC8F_09135 [Cetobacterium sp.]
MSKRIRKNQRVLTPINTEDKVKTFIKNDIDKIATTIALMYDVNVYEKTLPYLNKPMANIAAGHALNINWDNITEKFNIIKNLLSYAVYLEDVTSENIANKIVQRGADKKIKVENIILPTAINEKFEKNFGYKTSTGELAFTNNSAEIRKMLDVPTFEEAVKPNAKVDTNGSFNIGGGSKTITLSDEAKKYKVLIIKAGGTTLDVHNLLLLPNQWIKTREHDRNGGGEMHILWDGETSIKVNHYVHRDYREGRCEGVWGLI